LLVPVVLALFAFPGTAHAHTTIKGLGEFANGIVHPLTTPAHVLILLGLGLLAGQHPPLNLKPLMLVFAPLLAIALALTTTGLVQSVYPPILICLALGLGALVALAVPVPPLASRTLFALAALAIGFDSAVESNSTAAVVKTLLGTWLIVVFVVCDLAYYVSLGAGKKWIAVGIRVIGSWIIAISLLVLAFSLRK